MSNLWFVCASIVRHSLLPCALAVKLGVCHIPLPHEKKCPNPFNGGTHGSPLPHCGCPNCFASDASTYEICTDESDETTESEESVPNSGGEEQRATRRFNFFAYAVGAVAVAATVGALVYRKRVSFKREYGGPNSAFDLHGRLSFQLSYLIFDSFSSSFQGLAGGVAGVVAAGAVAKAKSARGLVSQRRENLLVTGGVEATPQGVVPGTGPSFIRLDDRPGVSSSAIDRVYDEGVEVEGPMRPSSYRAMA
jgi:hypothetical protein